MKEFEPSKDFVSRVMKSVHDYERMQAKDAVLVPSLFSLRSVRYAMSAGGLLLGIANLIRLYFTLFSPVLCR
ncbi:MAG: hypothetical protein HY880_01620 [Deltaproteobacteria bacterium]|nr:hypothetical protein [Deltaproteobacteria bacterium]